MSVEDVELLPEYYAWMVTRRSECLAEFRRTPEKYGLALECTRRDQGVSRATLAAGVGIAVAFLEDIEEGRCFPSAELAARFHRILEVGTVVEGAS